MSLADLAHVLMLRARGVIPDTAGRRCSAGCSGLVELVRLVRLLELVRLLGLLLGLVGLGGPAAAASPAVAGFPRPQVRHPPTPTPAPAKSAPASPPPLPCFRHALLALDAPS
ncbi:MAG: hypothetical protein ACRD0K_21330 [Egibacteraceae bacterium]